MTTAVDLPGALDQPGQSGQSAVTWPRHRKHVWTGFAVVLAAMIMNLLDSTIVNVAAPSIQRDLGMSSSALEWIAAAYTLAIAVGLMTGGRLGDMFGRKRMLMIGLTGFVLASAACALVSIRAKVSAEIAVELPYSMTILPALSDSLLDRDGRRHSRSPENRLHRPHREDTRCC